MGSRGWPATDALWWKVQFFARLDPGAGSVHGDYLLPLDKGISSSNKRLVSLWTFSSVWRTVGLDGCATFPWNSGPPDRQERREAKGSIPGGLLIVERWQLDRAHLPQFPHLNLLVKRWGPDCLPRWSLLSVWPHLFPPGSSLFLRYSAACCQSTCSETLMGSCGRGSGSCSASLSKATPLRGCQGGTVSWPVAAFAAISFTSAGRKRKQHLKQHCECWKQKL